MSRAPSRFSILLTALETVALESFSSAAAPAKERISNPVTAGLMIKRAQDPLVRIARRERA
jgi:hypothetical protein